MSPTHWTCGNLTTAASLPGILAGVVLLSAACTIPASPAEGFPAATVDHPDEPVTFTAGSAYDEPVHITSEERNDTIAGDVHAIVQNPFPVLVAELRSGAAWCEFIFLHLNVKACLHGGEQDRDESGIGIFVGRKHYQPPEEAERLDLRMRIATRTEDRLVVELEGDRGPYGTRDYRLRLDAMPHNETESLIHLHYSLGIGGLTRFVMQFYFTLAGRHRVGFTVVDLDRDGEPIYVRDLRGMLERNVMRIYLALQVYLDTLDVPQPERFDERLRRWFEGTERYPRQLHEMDKETYIEQKHRERAQQEKLQAEYRGS